MKANCWMDKRDMQVQDVDDPAILSPGDVIVKITSTAICGSDLHLYNGYVPTLEKGDILGHEFMGEVVETGPSVKRLAVGDRVVVPFTISCGGCSHCATTPIPMVGWRRSSSAIRRREFLAIPT